MRVLRASAPGGPAWTAVAAAFTITATPTIFVLDVLLPPSVGVTFLYALPLFTAGLSLSYRAYLVATGIAFSLSSLDLIAASADGHAESVLNHWLAILVAGAAAIAGWLCRDVMTKGERESRLRQQDEQLRVSQRMAAVGQLADGVAHEYNNLLQVMQGYTDFAKQALPTDSNAYNDLEHALAAGDRAATLTRQLLNFSRRESAGPQAVTVDEVMFELGAILRSCVPATVDLQIDVQDQEATIYSDPVQLHQVLLHLCVEMRDAIESCGRLRVSTQQLKESDFQRRAIAELEDEGDYVEFSISATAKASADAIPPAAPRVAGYGHDSTDGTGHRLAGIHSVVEEAGGRLRVSGGSGESGEMPDYLVYWPMYHAPDGSPTTGATRPEIPRGRGEVILIAEDEPLVLKLAVRILEDAGYRTIAVADGEQAVEQFVANADDIDLLILDLAMPRMGGKETAATIRLIRPDARIAFCTGSELSSPVTRSSDASSTHFIGKPFDSAGLLEAVRAALDNGPEEIVPRGDGARDNRSRESFEIESQSLLKVGDEV